MTDWSISMHDLGIQPSDNGAVWRTRFIMRCESPRVEIVRDSDMPYFQRLPFEQERLALDTAVAGELLMEALRAQREANRG